MATEINPPREPDRRPRHVTRLYGAPVRMPAANARGLALTGSILAVSGVALGLLRFVVPGTNAFSVYPHPWWPYLVMVHVLATPAFFFFVGSIWWRHVVRHWRSRERRLSGVAVVAILGLVAASGYALYFVGSEGLVSATRIVHTVGGTAATLVYAHHAVVGLRAVAAHRRGRN